MDITDKIQELIWKIYCLVEFYEMINTEQNHLHKELECDFIH